MKKKIFTLIFMISLLLCSFNVVKATDLASFKKGDLIEVELNKNLKGNFYVISDSNNNDLYVEAVYDGVLGEEFTYEPTSDKFDSMSNTAYNKLNTLTKDWTNTEQVRLLNANEIYSKVDLTKAVNHEFTKPDYFNINKNYWTQSIVKNDGVFMPVLVTNRNTYSNLHTTVKDASASKAAIRPVVKIVKTFVTNGITNIPKTWDEYVKGFEKFINSHLNDSMYTVEITHTENTLDVSIFAEEETISAKFNYQNGVLIANDEKNDQELTLMMALYNIHQNKELLYIMKEASGDIDTQYFKLKNITGSNGKSSYYLEIDLNHYFGLLDNDNKAIEEANKDKNAKNPKTVDVNITYTISILVIVCLILFAAAKKLKKIK